MKKIAKWLLASALFVSACQLFTPHPVKTETSPLPPTAEVVPYKPDTSSGDKFAPFRDGLIQSQQALLDTLDGASFYSITFTIQDDLVDTTGLEELHYTNQETVPLDEIDFRLLPNVLSGQMKVASVRVNDQPFEPTYQLENSLMRVPLYQPLQPGEITDITIEFTVTVPTSLDSNYGILAYFDKVLTLAHAYPMVAVYDDKGWNAEIPPDQGDPVYADASFFVVKVDAPERLVLVGSGREINREKNGSRQIVTFAAGPARDFYLAASPDYEVVSETVGGVTFKSYAKKDSQTGSQMALDVAEQAVEMYGERYAPYPYTEFDIVSTPTYALGIEYPGVVAIASHIYDVNDTANGTPNSVIMESTVAHEVGHQWFYNLVGNNQLDEPWLDESLTQFVTWQYFADRYGQSGANGFEDSLRSRWARVDDEPIPIGLPVAEYSGPAYSAIIYGRGPFFFDALRNRMGDSTFDAFIKDYTVSNSWGIATGKGLESLAEKHCNCNLTALYKEWVSP